MPASPAAAFFVEQKITRRAGCKGDDRRQPEEFILPLHSRKSGVVQFEAKKKRMKKEKDRVSGPYDGFPVSAMPILGLFAIFRTLRLIVFALGEFFFWIKRAMRVHYHRDSLALVNFVSEGC